MPDYLKAPAEGKTPDVLLAALAEVVKARGIAKVATVAGLGRESILKAFGPSAHPRFETINAVICALNINISVVSATTESYLCNPFLTELFTYDRIK